MVGQQAFGARQRREERIGALRAFRRALVVVREHAVVVGRVGKKARQFRLDLCVAEAGRDPPARAAGARRGLSEAADRAVLEFVFGLFTVRVDLGEQVRLARFNVLGVDAVDHRGAGFFADEHGDLVFLGDEDLFACVVDSERAGAAQLAFAKALDEAPVGGERGDASSVVGVYLARCVIGR